MALYEATLRLATPNEEGRNIDFTSSPILKEIRQHLESHNNKQQKQIKILSVTEDSLDVIMDTLNNYGDGRDFTALSNILRNNGWIDKYSSTKIY